jgi:pantoate ligase/cytidylate kinase
VNPLQFGPTEDFAKYPRLLEQDCQICQDLGVDIVFNPSPEALGIFSDNQTQTMVIPPESLTRNLCAAFRPEHFAGVATIVSKLFNIIQPEIAYFGEKDAQQLAIIHRLVQDLNLPVKIKGCSIIRETSGLALSSRSSLTLSLYLLLRLVNLEVTTLDIIPSQ